MPVIATARLRLIPATEAHLRASLEGREALAKAIGCAVPASWPPEHFDEAAVRFTLDWLRRSPRDVQWGFYYVELPGSNGSPGTLVGAGGFKGAPDADGIVEQFLRLPTLAGLGCYGLAAICYTLSLRAIPLSIAYPSVSASYVIVVVVSHLLWKEPLGLQQMAAVLLISGGIGLLYWKA